MEDQSPSAFMVGGRFKTLAHDKRVALFFSWLPANLHTAPGIDWEQLPDKVMLYCLHTVGRSPDAAHLALAVATAAGKVSNATLFTWLGALHLFFRTLRSVCDVATLADLQQTKIWQQFAQRTPSTALRNTQLTAYAAFQSRHFPQYLQRLDPTEREGMQVYALPPIPARFRKRYGGATQLAAAIKLRRSELQETIIPFYPLLLEAIHLRKEMAERVFCAIQRIQQEVETCRTNLPARFLHTDRLPYVDMGALEIQEKPVSMDLILWDKATWVLHHPERFSQQKLQRAKKRRGAYRSELEMFFVESQGTAEDLFWFGDLIEQRVLQRFTRPLQVDEDYTRRWEFARSLGFSHGCQCSRPGLLTSADRWLAHNAYPGDLLFEPQSLRRGILYASALTTISLSHGNSLNMLLQMSADRWQETNGQLQQYLLPAGAKTEHNRQLFSFTNEAVHLLEEISRELDRAYGSIPVVLPSRKISLADFLKPERFLFQWAAALDGSTGILEPNDVQVLVRFILHGLNVRTPSGKQVQLSLDLLRDAGDFSLAERGHEILQIMGFNHGILAGSLSPASLSSYCRDFYAFVTYARTKEKALQPETLVDWQQHLRARGYASISILRMLSVVRRLLKEARNQGYIKDT